VLMAYAENDSEARSYVAAFREALEKLGWIEGRNIEIEIRWAALDLEAMQRFAKELVALEPDVILSHSTPTTVALLQQTRTIPIIFGIVSDPVGSGFVASLARPGGNATGFTNLEASLAGKWLELLKEVAPHVNRVAFLFNPVTATYAEYYLTPFKAGRSHPQGCERSPATRRRGDRITLPSAHGMCCNCSRPVLGQLGPQEMSDLSPNIDLKRTLLGPQSPIEIFDVRHDSASPTLTL
jgi:ABC transporter substrate binding protein